MPTELEFDPEASCGSSRAVGEPVSATATHAFEWIVLEVPKPWGRKALPESDLPEQVKAHLNQADDKLEGGRVLFITREYRGDPDPLHLYLARSREEGSTLTRFELDSYEDLLDLDLVQAMHGRGSQARESLEQSIFLCCTNGKRDPCCARLGLAAYRALAEKAPGRVWQSSHQGGHRFSGNLIVLPEGLQYGRTQGENAGQVHNAHSRGEILLDLYRGRTLYTSPAQAAEHYLRKRRNLLGIDALRLQSIEQIGEGTFEVQFQSTSNGATWRLSVQGRRSDYQVYKTTGDKEPAHVTLHEVVEAPPV